MEKPRRGRKTIQPKNKLRQVSVDMIVDSMIETSKIDKMIQSAMRSTLLPIVKARIGIVEVVHQLTDKGPMYIPITELNKEKDNGRGNGEGATGLQGDTKEGDGGTSPA